MAAVRPMLAVKAGDLETLPYPLYASRKLDGIRCLITPDGPQTRSGEPIPNDWICEQLATLPVGLDGELCCVNPQGIVDFRLTTGNVRRKGGKPEFVFYVFDDYTKASEPFAARFEALSLLRYYLAPFVQILQQVVLSSPQAVRTLFAEVLERGDEGLVLRHPDGLYKHGRSTLKEAGMLKVKPYEDAEAYVIEAFPRLHNTNEATKDNLGHTKRANTKDAKAETGLLGGFWCVKLEDIGVDRCGTFKVSAGKMTHEESAKLWAAKDQLVGKIIRFQHVTVGGYDKPRHGTFQGFREKWDMDGEG